MAEIKSTMDLVMERMARMTKDTAPSASNEDVVKEGMRLAAEYLNTPHDQLIDKLSTSEPGKQQAMFKGAAQTLLRNVVLPRDEMLQERSELALTGVMNIAGNLGVSAISQICSELTQILQQYNQHKEQVTQQLEEALKAQLTQQYGGRGVEPEQIRASMHPKYQEEMGKMQQELNDQYNQAMEQRKDTILQQLGLA